MAHGVVENCIFLAIECFHSWGTFQSPSGTKGTLSWNNSRHGAEMGKLEYVVVDEGDGPVIRFPRQFTRLYGAVRFIEECTITLTTTRCRFGGERLWFKCPFTRQGMVCGRRVGRLYLPPGQAMFGCRTCQNLIHRSAREHDARRDKLRRDPAAMTAALADKRLSRRLLALSALTRQLGSNH